MADVEVTELVEFEASRLDGVGTPANGTSWLIMKAKGADDDEKPVTPFGEHAGEKLSPEDRAKFKANSQAVHEGKEPGAKKDDGGESHDSDSAEADAQQDEMTAEKAEADEIEDELTKAAKAAHDEGAFCGDEDCAKCVVKDGESYRLRTGVSPVTKAAKQSRAYWDAVIKEKADPNVGGGVDRSKIPAEDFAGKDRSFPIVTPGDVSDAASSIGRAGSENFSADELKANIKRIAHRKGPKFVAELPKKWQREDAKAAAKNAVQDGLQGTRTPEYAGTVDGSKQSMVAATAGVKTNLGSVVPSDQSPSSIPGVIARLRGGESAYEIPAEAEAYTVRSPGPRSPQIAMDASKAAVVSTLWEAMDHIAAQRAATKQGAYLQVPGPADASAAPGSMPWESYDAATLDQVATVLAQCVNAVECICTREQIEAISGDAGDQEDAWSLQCASDCLDQAMGIVARLAYAEGAEAAKSEGEVEKAYRRLYAGDHKALRDAHAALTNVLAEHERAKAKAKGASVEAGSSEPSEGDKIQMELTKEELVETVETSAQKASAKAAAKAVKAAIRSERKRAEKAAAQAAKRAAKSAQKAAVEAALKNANNGGDITQQQMEGGVHGEHDASDIQSVGGAVQSKYLNKAIKRAATRAAKKQALAQLKGQLEALSGETQAVGQLVKSFADAPRRGGPILDGVGRGELFASQGRQGGGDGQVAKSERDQRIEVLEKQYESATSAAEKQNVGFELTKLRLEKSHEQADQSLPIRFFEGL